IVGNDLDFLNCILVAEEDRWTTDGVVVVVLSIDLEVISPPTHSIGREGLTVGIAEAGISDRRNTGQEQGERVEIIADRETRGFLHVKCVCDLVGCGLDQRSGALDSYSFSGGSKLESDCAQRCIGSHSNCQIYGFVDTKRLRFNFDVVLAWRDSGEG